MQQQTCQMVPRRLEVEPLAIQHVRHPRQRMPIAGIKGLERPGHAGPRQPPLDMRVARDVQLVVVKQELMGADWPIHGQGDETQSRADQSLASQVPRAIFHAQAVSAICAAGSTAKADFSLACLGPRS